MGVEKNLVGMKSHSVYRCTTFKITLAAWGTKVPNFDGVVLRPCEHPLSVLLKANCCDVGFVPIETRHRIGVVGAKFKETNMWIASHRDVIFGWEDFELVHVLEMKGAEKKKKKIEMSGK